MTRQKDMFNEPDPELQKAIDAYTDARDARMEATKVEVRQKAALLAAMQAKNPKLMEALEMLAKFTRAGVKFLDDDGEERAALIEASVNVKVRKTGNADSPVGDGVEAGPDDPMPAGSVLEQAAKRQDASAATDEKPKKKRGKRP